MSLLDFAKRMGTGTEIVFSWVGSGGNTVTQHEAQLRSDICTGRLSGVACPYNVAENFFTGSAGETVKKLVEIKNGSKLRVRGEKSLGNCAVCKCHLRTKIWTPMEHIRKHTTDDELRELPPICWQRVEVKI